MPDDLVLLDVAQRIATLTINRPEKLNALNDAVLAELRAQFDALAARDDVGVLILTGAGRAFVAGADISAIAAEPADRLEAFARAGQAVFRKIERLPKPVIAAVNGFALGGGCELALACHLRVASQQAKFGFPEVKLGLIPGYGGTQRLARVVGRARALQLILTGEPIDGAEAYRIGLANAATSADMLMETAKSLARTILKNGPVAIARALEAVDRGLDVPLDDALALEAKLFGSLGRTADMREGTTAFLEKRAARFRGA